MHAVDGPVALPARINVVGVRDRGLEPGQRHGWAYTVTAYMRDTATVIESISRYDEYGTDSQRFRFRNRFQPQTVSALLICQRSFIDSQWDYNCTIVDLQHFIHR